MGMGAKSVSLNTVMSLSKWLHLVPCVSKRGSTDIIFSVSQTSQLGVSVSALVQKVRINYTDTEACRGSRCPYFSIFCTHTEPPVIEPIPRPPLYTDNETASVSVVSIPRPQSMYVNFWRVKTNSSHLMIQKDQNLIRLGQRIEITYWDRF